MKGRSSNRWHTVIVIGPHSYIHSCDLNFQYLHFCRLVSMKNTQA